MNWKVSRRMPGLPARPQRNLAGSLQRGSSWQVSRQRDALSTIARRLHSFRHERVTRNAPLAERKLLGRPDIAGRFGYHEAGQNCDQTRHRGMKNIFRNQFSLLSLVALVFAAGGCVAADQAVNDVLRPPKGAQVAIVVFEDLQCPQCRRVAPILEQASKTYKIPLVRHDVPLPFHTWSFDAAVFARYFDTHFESHGQRIPRLHLRQPA